MNAVRKPPRHTASRVNLRVCFVAVQLTQLPLQRTVLYNMQLLCGPTPRATKAVVEGLSHIRILGNTVCLLQLLLQAHAAEGDGELDELLSAPRLLLAQFIAKWVAATAEDVPTMPQAAAEKLLLDVSGTQGVVCLL
jgi:hypothetical protein